MSLSKNILLNTDSYKVSMYKQYPPNTTGVYSYIESRGGTYDNTLFFGLQGFIKEYLLTPITQNDIDIAEEILTTHGEPFNRKGWEYILNTHNGFLPLEIKAVPEGTIVPIKNVLLTVENTDPNCYWLTTYLETALLRAIWYPTTVATQSKYIKSIIESYLNLTGDPSLINFKLHDFGARGVSSFESASIGGAAHLINFMGTDTISGILYVKEYYNGGVCGFSIPAAEHSTITSWGKENEIEAYRNMLNQFAHKNSIVAVVSDSYDIYNAVSNIWGEQLKEQVISSGATVVIRPDSGDPTEVCIKLVEILGDKFGYTTNKKGYKVLNYVRLIQGDGINQDSIKSILHEFQKLNWSADNIAFGMGGALLQQINRDTQQFAMKCSSVKINDTWNNVEKNPITDSNKRSKAGRITLWKNDSNEYISSIIPPDNSYQEALRTIFYNGYIIQEINFEEIRNNSNK